MQEIVRSDIDNELEMGKWLAFMDLLRDYLTNDEAILAGGSTDDLIKQINARRHQKDKQKNEDIFDTYVRKFAMFVEELE